MPILLQTTISHCPGVLQTPRPTSFQQICVQQGSQATLKALLDVENVPVSPALPANLHNHNTAPTNY